MEAEAERRKLARQVERMEAEIKELHKKITEKDNSKPSKYGGGNSLSYSLVVIMLATLGILVFMLIIMPLWEPKKDPKDLMEYYKWALSVLVGAFGAWVGAGAAYFFGKENLQESSRSTERAMEIQQGSFRRLPALERVKDMNLTAMNANFIFDFGNTKKEVKDLLAKFKGYWFVPVVEKDSGVLQDVVHAQVFWDPGFDDDLTLQDIVAKMDEQEATKKLHGESFYVKISPEDKISEVYKTVSQRDSEVAIVVDEKGKPSHCLTKTDLRSFLKVTDGK
jgi:hypothetical protein